MYGDVPFHKSHRTPIIDYPFSPEPANKYDAMSDDELVCAICGMGLCSASNFNIRHADCPFKNTPVYNSPATRCNDFLHAHPEFRPALVQYLADEDAAKEPKPEPKPVKHLYDGKVVCVKKANEFLTEGKVYTFKNGKSSDDNGTTFPCFGHIRSIEHLNEELWSDFIEYKGEAT